MHSKQYPSLRQGKIKIIRLITKMILIDPVNLAFALILNFKKMLENN